ALRQAILEAIEASPDTLAKEMPSGAMQVALLEALQDRQRYEPPVSARTSSAFDRSALHALSACFVDWAEKDYGTRSSTLIWVNSAQTDTFGLQEWTYVNGAIDQAISVGPQYLRMG
ncbi:MAG: NRDE family protein, partial [Burkholderiaceae bacterium]